MGLIIALAAAAGVGLMALLVAMLWVLSTYLG